jgi:alpha,alpha-trehalase
VPEVTGWSLVYEGFVAEQEGLRETLCALGNGYFVTRGAAPDALADGVHYPGTYLAGGYDRATSEIAGRQIENEDLVNTPNWLPLAIRIDDEDWLRPGTVEYLNYRQELDLRSGILMRNVRFRDAAGRVTRWEERRLVSMADQHLAALAVTVTPENWSGRLVVRSAIDGSVLNRGVARYRGLESRHLETLNTEVPSHGLMLLRSRMRQCPRVVSIAARTDISVPGSTSTPQRFPPTVLADLVAEERAIDATAGATVQVEKIVAIYTSTDLAISDPGGEALSDASRAGSFAAIEERHKQAWRHLWQDCDIDIECEDEPQTAMKLRLHIFHLLQTVSRHSVDLDVGVPPRGWHGEAYRGHVMWDELFIFPFLNLRLPILTRALLRYRYRRLPAARRAAAADGLNGALFPWQSGSDGREESQKVHLNPMSGQWIPDNSYRQRHINAAIAYNVWQYYQVTDDAEFLKAYGAELLIETSRFWVSIARFDPAMDRYHIAGVMGPDEFHTAYPGADATQDGGLNNNAYTNVMASWTLARALDVLEMLPEDAAQRLKEKLGIDATEIERWDDVSRKLRVAFHDDGIISQFEGYDALEDLDWGRLRRQHGDIQRLDRILDSDGDDPNRYKASKQADVLMLFYLFSVDELALIFERLGYPFSGESVPKNIDYYMARTSHGSTLSWVVHAWVIARGDRQRAWTLFRRALNSDFRDIQGGTTPEGIHLGAMAGTVDLVQRCFTGIETRANVLHLNPDLPKELNRLRTTVNYRGHCLDLEVDHDTLRVTSRSGTLLPVTIAYRGHTRSVTPGASHTFRLIRPEARQRDENRAADVPAGRATAASAPG